MTRTLRLSVLLSIAAGLIYASTASAAYNFVKIVGGEGEFTGVGGGVSLNNSGVVAFQGFTSAGRGVFTSDGLTITTIVEPSESFTSIGPTLINDSGVVAFAASTDSVSSGIYTGSGGSLTTVVAANGPVAPFGSISLNNNGDLAYTGSIGASIGIHKHSAGTSTQLANTLGPFRYFSSPQINDAGDVAFFADHDAINTVGYYKVPNGAVRETIVEGPGVFNSGTLPSMNSSGTVAFVHFTQQNGYGVFTYSNGTLTKALDPSGPFKDFAQTVDINDLGIIAFTGTLDTNVRGIYTGSNPVSNKVVEVGGALFGSTVTEVYGTPLINNRGDVAFYYQLADGSTGLALAKAVPEPCSAVLLATAAAVIGARRRRVRA